MVRPARIRFQSLLGACAGATAGPIFIGVLLGLITTLFSLCRDGLKYDPVAMLFVGSLGYGLYVGLPLGVPIGALIGLVAVGIRGMRSGNDSTPRKTKIPDDDFAAPPAKNVVSAGDPFASLSCGLYLAVVLAIPALFLLGWTINAWLEKSRFDRFSAEVARSGGSAENGALEYVFFSVGGINVDLSSTATDDDDLERLTHDELFKEVASLSLAGTRITDRSVVMLVGFPGIGFLDLSRTSVTDRGLASMSRSRPYRLNLSGTNVTDTTLELMEQEAKRFTDSQIDLTDTKVTEERVRALGAAEPQWYITYGSAKSPQHTK